MKTFISVSLALVLTASIAHAAGHGYRYVDERGVVHWAQSIHNVPLKYRSKSITPDLRDETLFPKKARPSRNMPAPDRLTSPGATAQAQFAYTSYVRTVLPRVTKAWKGHSRRGPQPVVALEVFRDGTVTKPRLERSSGDADYDRKALHAVTAASPFPPLPRDFPPAALQMRLAFTHVEKRR